MHAASRAMLVVERHDQPPRRFAVGDRTFRIGRSADNDLQVPEGHVSKHHAEIRPTANRFVIVDLGSRAGLLVNGEAVTEHELAPGDVIELGNSSPVRIAFALRDGSGVSNLELTLAGSPTTEERGGMARLARFFEFSRKLGGGFSLAEVLDDVVDLAIEVTHAERGILLLRRPHGELETRIARTNDGQSLPTDGLRISETILGQAFESGRASVIQDVGQNADLALAESIVSLELRSAVTLPLLRFRPTQGSETATSEVFGVIYLDSRRRRDGFDRFDLRILERLAQDASSVIENARLLGEAEERRRIAREIAMAREVQAALMPEQFVSTPTCAIAGVCVPCHDLGGDYVDQFDLGGGRYALVVADVCGKGIAASLLAATLQGALAAEITEPRALGEIVARVNRVHCRLAPIGKFVTMVLVVIERDGSVAIVNAGHCPPLHVGAHGVTALEATGIALGLDADAPYAHRTLQLRAGDTLVLYSDGIIESAGPGSELFGEDRLIAVLRESAALPAAAQLDAITTAVGAFRSGVAANDDLTAVVLRRN